MSSVRTIVVILVAVVAAPRRAVAEPDAAVASAEADDARRILASGLAHYDAGRFEEAVAAFREVYALTHSARVRVNLADALWKLGRAAEAARELDALLDDDADADVAGRAREMLVEIARVVAHLELRVGGTAAVALDGQAVGTAPIEHETWLSPGRHELQVGRHREVLTVAAGERHRIVLDAVVEATRRRLAPPPRRRWLVAGGVTGVVLISGLAFGTSAWLHERDLDELDRTSAQHDFAVADGVADRARRDAWIANASFALAGVGVVVTAWLFHRDRRVDDDLEVGVGPGQAFVTGRF